MTPKKFSNFSWWQIALISLVASAIGGLASGKPKQKERKLYNRDLQQAPWAPPAWVFAPAWSINNYFLLKALQKIIAETSENRKKLLFLQACIWMIFFSFGFVYFRKKSAVLAAVWTIGDATLAAFSFLTAQKTDKKLAYHYLPLLTWTTFASSVAIYQALENPDPLLNTKALLQ